MELKQTTPICLVRFVFIRSLYLFITCKQYKAMKIFTNITSKYTQFKDLLGQIDRQLKEIQRYIEKYWFRIALAGIVLYGLVERGLSIQVNLAPQAQTVAMRPASDGQAGVNPKHLAASIHNPMNISLNEKPAGEGIAKPRTSPEPEATTSASSPVSTTRTNSLGELANEFKNVSFPDQDERYESLDKRAGKRQKQLAYVKRFVKLAQGEQHTYGIPASIILAQGLLESDAGESPLSLNANNHFGIKCFSRSCHRGHCRNFTDDSHKDFFRVFPSAWESYRSHSLLLQGPRYRGLKKLGDENYSAWARGLSKAGYATDKKYAEKLIHLIEDLELYRYD
jgi:flagellum-specific peptidoglycan hydrolase FlgJ